MVIDRLLMPRFLARRVPRLQRLPRLLYRAGRFPVSAVTFTTQQPVQRWIWFTHDLPMREVQFRLLTERPGLLEAEANVSGIRRIAAPSLEELHHEAREALIDHFGPAHGVYRVRIDRPRLDSCAHQRHNPRPIPLVVAP